MEYFSRAELTKSYGNNKLYIGGVGVDYEEPIIETYKKEHDSIMDILNLGLSIPLMYYSKPNKNNRSSIKNSYDSSIVNESLHNHLLGLLNNKSFTKKNRNYIKKTRKQRYS